MSSRPRARRLVGALCVALGLLPFACSSRPPAKVPRTVEPAPIVAASPVPSTTTETASPEAGAPWIPGHLTSEQICALPQEIPAGDASPRGPSWAPAEPRCEEKNPFCDWVETPPDPRDVCFVANTNIRRAERETRPVHPPRQAPGSPWDGRTKPKMLDRVESHLHLTTGEEELLAKQGFVVLDRIAYDSYAAAYHDVFQEQLPVFVGIDAILHSIFQSNGSILQHVESERLQPRLVKMIDGLRKKLASAPAAYDAVTRADLDVYLSVAKLLLTRSPDEPHRTLFGEDDLVKDLYEKVEHAQELEPVELFGRPRMVDFSQYTPRGHYAGQPDFSSGSPVDLGAYFQAMTWLSRLEYNLVSRSCRSSHPDAAPDPSETPREARDAIALADLMDRAQVLGDLKEFEDVYSVFAGGREDVSIPDMLALMKQAKISPSDREAPAKLRAAIGDRFQRTARTHFMPQGSTVLPAILTVLGPRIVPDIAPLTRLVHDKVAGREVLGADDVAYVLGHDRAKLRLAKDITRFPALARALDDARAEVKRTVATRKDLYSLWLSGVLELSERPEGAVPSFMRGDAYADFRINSALVGFAQIRHNYVLLAGEGYDAYGCEIPDGYVEPAIGTYDALLAYARAAAAVDAKHAPYFKRVAEVLSMLRSISRTELSGARLSEPQRRWLGMVAEYIPIGGYGDSGEPPKWTGWYFDLFPDREIGAEKKSADFVADYFTLTNANQVRYIGGDRPRVGVFVVDVNGEPRAMVGPVAKGYELARPIGPRLDDNTVIKAEDKTADWLGYVASGPKKEPAISVQESECSDEWRVVLQTDRSLGEVSVELVDHHGDAVGSPVTRRVSEGETLFAFRLPPGPSKGPGAASPIPSPYPMTLESRRRGSEGVHVYVHDLDGQGRYDLVTGIRSYQSPWVYRGEE